MSKLAVKDAYYQNIFAGLTIDEQLIENKEFEDVVFTKCTFISTSFKYCRFIDCRFSECSISAVQIPNCKIINSVFTNSKVIGIDWTKAVRVENIVFDTCQVDYSNFSYLKLPKLKMINCVAQEVDFVETDLTNAKLSGTDFAKARFSKTNLTKADLRSAKNYYVDIRTNTVTKAHFSFPEVMGLLTFLDVTVDY